MNEWIISSITRTWRHFYQEATVVEELLESLGAKYGIPVHLDSGVTDRIPPFPNELSGELPIAKNTRSIRVPASEALKGLEIEVSYSVPIVEREIVLKAKSPGVGSVDMLVQSPALLVSVIIALVTAHESEKAVRDTEWINVRT